jgi:hypothetical protein
MNEQDTKLTKLMRFWLFGTFVITFAAVTIYGGMFGGTAIFREVNYWLIQVVVAVACAAIYFGYSRWWLKRKA